MPRVNVYLPEDLAARAKRADLNVSALVQESVRRALGEQDTNVWLATLDLGSGSGEPVTHDAALAALDAEREQDALRHG